VQQLPTGAREAPYFSAYPAAILLNGTTEGLVGMSGKTIHAAGGIVVRNDVRPLIAVVQRAKDELWVLPRGKLKVNESPLAGARREVVEETGHRVRVREFLGAIAYRARGRPKVVQFWHMRATVNPSRDVTKDIMAVEWLPLSAAVRRLSYPLEKLFLHSVGRMRCGDERTFETQDTPPPCQTRRRAAKHAATNRDCIAPRLREAARAN
jgi:8-oxo-dGTP pyrophosphatase MutT (NUDIX family)